ncbi:MAG: choice-of-anchor L domain-containing protein, partial [Bacteroidota bacterium]
DTQLNTTIGSLTSKNATVLEFNFVPSASTLAFTFLYASEEYGTFQCDYGDAFAILLTDNTTGVTVNLGVVPGTDTPISSYSVRNGAYNSACAGANVAYFGTFYQPGVVDGPMNFNGRTVPFFVDTPIEPGHNYHIKFVIADRTDEQFDSALFLNGGSFNTGAPLPPEPIIISTLPPYSLCDDNNDGFALFDLAGYMPQVLGAVSPTGNYSVTYYETPEDADAGDNAISITGGYTNNVSLEQTLYVRVTLVGNTDMYAVGTLNIVATPSPIYEDNLSAIAICPGTATDLTVNVNELENISEYAVTYHLTEVAAIAGTPAITQPEAFVSQSDEVFIWVRITDPETGCFEVLLQPVLTWAAFVVVNIDEANVAVWYEDEVDGFDFTLALNGVSTTQSIFTLAELNYCNNTLTVTNTTCNTSTDIFFSIYPPAPTGESPQIFTQGQTLADLDIEGTGISWFTAAVGGTFLSMDTPLQDGVIYYAAQLIDNCAGIERLPVMVNLVAGLNGNSLAALRCYPNPVKNELKLEHTTTLLSATLYNTLGQEALNAQINNTTATLKLDNLANGIYLMKVKAENGEKIIKVVKE